MKFVVVGDGDLSVGIPPSETTVSFITSYEWTDELIEQTKEMLKEWDDNGTTVYTEDEWFEYCKETERLARQMEEQK